MRKKGWFMIASVALAAVAAGCGTTSPLAGPGTTVATTPSTTVPKKASIHNPAPAKVTTPSTIVGHPIKTRATAGAIDDPALGDLATVDACSLIPVSGFKVPAAYAKKSDLQLQQYAQYGECEAVVVLKHNEDGVYVAVQGSYSPHSASLTKYLAKIPSRVEKAGKLQLLFPDHQTYSSSCFVGALTPGDTLLTITVTTNTTGKGGTQAECPLAAIAAKEVAATVNAGRVRHFTWPADSMGRRQHLHPADQVRRGPPAPGGDDGRQVE